MGLQKIRARRTILSKSDVILSVDGVIAIIPLWEGCVMCVNTKNASEVQFLF